MLAFTLPAGLRPSGAIWLPADGYVAAKTRLEILTDGTVTVQSKGPATDATKFTSLEGVSFPVSAAAFTAVTLQNGWVSYVGTPPTRTPAVANINGIVRFIGAISTGTNTAAFTLAASLAPTGTVYVTADEYLAAEGRMIFQATGTASPDYQNVFTDAQQFTSLEGVWYAQATTGYTALTLQNGWAPYSSTTRAPAVSVSGGIVRFQGAMKTSGTSGVAFTLPAGYLPAADVYTPVDTFAGNKGRLHVTTTGTVTVEPEGGSNGSFSNPAGFTSLEGVSFAQ